MFHSEIDFMVVREQHNDRLREAERERLARSMPPVMAGNGRLVRRAACEIGALFVRLGVALQHFGTTHPLSMAE